MNKNFLNLVIFLLFFVVSFAQSNIDAYKYIIVPDKYDSFKEADKYQLNSLTKFLFEKYGFKTLGEKTAFPAEVAGNPCLALTAKLNNESNMFTTKLSVDLVDCYNKVVFSTAIGKSKIKEYKPSYQEALRNAFISFKELGYVYDSSKIIHANQVVATSGQPVKTETPKVAVPVTPITEPTEKESVPMVALTPAQPIAENVSQKEASNAIAKSYKNKNTSFMLIEQGDKMVAYVKSSNNKTYKNGEKIGTFTKTSLPNVYRVTWKNQEGKFESTTGYIDDSGNLKIDINKNGKIEVVTFEVE